MEAVAIQDKPYFFRPYTQDDIPFIQNAWGKSYYSGGYGNSLLSQEEFHSHHRPIRERILSNPNCTAIVCTSTTDPTLIMAFIVVAKPKETSGMILHYLYVKQLFKGEGIAKELLEMTVSQRPVLYTHVTTAASKIISKFRKLEKQDFERFIYTPHLI